MVVEQSPEEMARRVRHEQTAGLMREFFADPENARLLIPPHYEPDWRDLPGPTHADGHEVTEEELESAVKRMRSEFLRRRRRNGDVR